jgi:hypothetical protein
MRKGLFPEIGLLLNMCFFLTACSFKFPQENVPILPPTRTVSLTSTDTQTSTPILTATPTPIDTPTVVEATPVNTMTSGEQANFVRAFLSNNGNCLLPCWWHVTPGQTWEDAESTIQGLGGDLVASRSGYDPGTTTYGTSISSRNIIPDVTIALEEKQGLVHAWHISSTGGVKDPEEFRRVWKHYLAHRVVKKYGVPDRVLLHASPATNSLQYGLYSLWLFYDERGFSILYEARIPRYFFGAPFFRLCPETDPLLNIYIHSQTPESPLPLDRYDKTLEQVRAGTELGKLIVIRSLQEATGLGDTEIYDTILQSEAPCFAIPSDIWRAKQ